MGGRGSAASRLDTTITDSDWMDWAADPEPFQAALRGEKMPDISQADGHHYTKGELNRIKAVATEIQRQALTSTANTDTLFRGEMYDSLLDARRKYKIGATITNDKLTSYTTSRDIASMYSEANLDFRPEGSVRVVITNVARKGNSVGVHTDPFDIGGSAEVITPMGMKSKVTGTHYDKASNTLYVSMTNNAVPSKNTKRKRK